MLRAKAEFSSRLPLDENEDGDVLPGKNAAEALREVLAGLGCAVEPVGDAGDHGWDFHFRRGEGEFYCELTLIDGVVAQFVDMSVRSTSARRVAEFADLLTQLGAALEADPRFHQLGWFTIGEAVSQQWGADSPTGPYSSEPCHRGIGPHWETAERPPWTGIETASDGATLPRAGRDIPAVRDSREPWTDLSPHPFRRWVARFFDGYVTLGALAAALATPMALADLDERAGWPLLAAMFVCLIGPVRGLLSAWLNALLLRWISTTPGKWLCGVRIVRKNGMPLTFRVALKRELKALLSGCGLYLPLVNLVVPGLSFRALRKHGATSWDEHHELIALQRPDSLAQRLLALLAFLPAVLAMAAVAVLGELLHDAAHR